MRSVKSPGASRKSRMLRQLDCSRSTTCTIRFQAFGIPIPCDLRRGCLLRQDEISGTLELNRVPAKFAGGFDIIGAVIKIDARRTVSALKLAEHLFRRFLRADIETVNTVYGKMEKLAFAPAFRQMEARHIGKIDK